MSVSQAACTPAYLLVYPIYRTSDVAENLGRFVCTAQGELFLIKVVKR